ncbi:MAG: alpha/beta hydrolase [Erysipelothrix sp.]|nr:alpha/beta hydrolase [Erysipelothrix sp.]
MRNYFYYNQLKLKTHYIDIPYEESIRKVRVLLPKDYDQETDVSYPVIYMHDGQNVFYSKESYSGYSWKVIPLLKKKDASKVIIVGINNAGKKRLDEYGPWVFDDKSHGGLGKAYAEWVVDVVKPFVDQHYRTKPERENTMLAGSSMGGLITAYMGARYPEVFGSLGVFSLASWLSEKEFLQFIEAHPLHPQTKVYIQVGTHEGNATDEKFTDTNINQAYINSSLWYYEALIRSGHHPDNIWLRVLFGETHSEKFWADHFGEYLQYSLD